MPLSPYYTADMVRNLPEDGQRYEVVAGELLVTSAVSVWHQHLIGRLFFALGNYLQRVPAGVLVHSPADISWASDVLVPPDLFIVPLAEARTGDWAAMQHLLLVIEVLSPSTARADRFVKRRRYQEAGVPLYWIVDVDAEQVEAWTPTDHIPRIERDALEWSPAGARTSFRLELNELFRAI